MTRPSSPTPDPLRARAGAAPGDTAIDARRGRWSYAELDAAADRLAATLAPTAAPRGVDGRPPVIAAFLPPTPSAVAAVHGVPRTGAALAPLSPEWTPAELAGVLERLAPSLLLAGEATEAAAREALDLAGIEAELVRLEEAARGEAPVRRPRGEARDRPAGGGTAPHSVLSTSGTSGRPRLVPLTADNHLASARAAIERLGLGPADRWLASLSFAHVGGIAMAVRAAAAGSALVLRGRFDAELWARELEEARVTHLSLVPTMLRRLTEARGGRPAPPRLACVLLGGAATDPATLERALAAGWPVALTYGLTETASQVATAEPSRVRAKPGTVGRPLRGTRVRIRANEIQVRGATTMAGYWDEPAPLAPDGWLRTGDLGRLDEEGDLWVLGRRSARIVTGGVNVDPAEVEAVLAGHPGVAEVAVLGIPDPEWGERVVAVVERSHGGPAPRKLAAELDRLCRGRLAGPKRPKTIRVVAKLPRTPTGKPDRRSLRASFGPPGGRSGP